MKNTLNWTPVKISIRNIKQWLKNPRKSSSAQAKKLIESEERFGQVQTIAISPFYPDGTVDLYDGHQRVKAWLTVKGDTHEMIALQCESHLSEEQRKDLVVTLHTATGSWNVDTLKSHWNMEELSEAFFPQVEVMRIEYEDIQSIFSQYEINGEDEAETEEGEAEPKINLADELQEE